MSGAQRIRVVLFYLSVLVFFSGLPFIISFALGFKFDRRTFKFTRTGLIVLKTQPPGATVYLNKTLLSEKTPTSISELLPGKYTVDLELSDCYPYAGEVEVQAGKVTRLEKIILFPVKPDLKKLNREAITNFWVDEARATVYYLNESEQSLYKSDLDGDKFAKVADFIALSPAPKQWKISPDKEKLCYYNMRQIGIVYLDPTRERPYQTQAEFIITSPHQSIIDVFWHSDSFHLIVVGNKKIDVLEARANTQPLTLVTLEKRDAKAFYDIRSDALYYLDVQRAEDGRYYENLYKLELNNKLSPLYELMKRAPTFEKQGAESRER
jgi:hypothetical protein